MYYTIQAGSHTKSPVQTIDESFLSIKPFVIQCRAVSIHNFVQRWILSRTFKRDINRDYGIYPENGDYVVMEAVDRNTEYEQQAAGDEDQAIGRQVSGPENEYDRMYEPEPQNEYDRMYEPEPENEYDRMYEPEPKNDNGKM